MNFKNVGGATRNGKNPEVPSPRGGSKILEVPSDNDGGGGARSASNYESR